MLTTIINILTLLFDFQIAKQISLSAYTTSNIYWEISMMMPIKRLYMLYFQESKQNSEPVQHVLSNKVGNKIRREMANNFLTASFWKILKTNMLCKFFPCALPPTGQISIDSYILSIGETFKPYNFFGFLAYINLCTKILHMKAEFIYFKYLSTHTHTP